jgi:Zn-dependent metalloprotease
MTRWSNGRGLVAALIGVLVLAAVDIAAPAAFVAAADDISGYRVLTGRDAAQFTIPGDVRSVITWTDGATGLSFERYQQYAAPLGVYVDGAELTIARRDAQTVLVIGKHYPALRVSSVPVVSPSRAMAIASGTVARVAATQDATVGTGSARSLVQAAQLRVDPDTNRQFYRVQSAAPGILVYHDVDAQSGAILQSWSGIQHLDPAGTGRGVKGDLKPLTGDVLSGPAALSTFVKDTWRLVSADGRYVTSDAQNTTSYSSNAMSDADNMWSAKRERAAVDAQYYAAVTDHFYLDSFGYDLVACLGIPIRSVVHYGRRYANAFWDPMARYIAFGDGDRSKFGQMSGAEDVVAHELTHAVTECRAPLDYQKESGALNEAFSDMMAASAEFLREEPTSSACKLDTGQLTCPDWWVAEDLIIGGPDHAIRSLANPALFGQPTHWDERLYQGGCNPQNWNDYCGVHANNGIGIHAFYLFANGGRNARCAGPTDTQADCDVLVPGVGISHAAQAFFTAWSMLTTNATYCEARGATIAATDALIAAHPESYTNADHVAADLAWRAVGVSCGASSFAFSISPQSHSVAARPGASADVLINVSRNTSAEPVTFSVSDPAPASAAFAPNPELIDSSSTTLHFDVPVDAPGGIHPLTVSATDGTTTSQASIVLVIDAEPPTASVGAARLALGDAVSTDGIVPLRVIWSTADAASGVVAGQLTVDGASLATGTSGPTTYSSVDGSHVFQASATDLAGNASVSNPLTVSQASYQENAAVYQKTWTSSTSASPWGTTLFAKAKGSTAVFTFTGTDIAWVSARGPKSGKAKVYIDSVYTATIDLKASATQSSRIVFMASGLAAGQPHTIGIRVLGTAGRKRVDVDGFVVLSQ